MRTAEKNMKQRSTYHPISIGWVLKIAFALAGFALWGWGFVAAVAGLWPAFRFLKGVLSCLLYLTLITGIIILAITIIFNII
jgi:hypothetical protein